MSNILHEHSSFFFINLPIFGLEHLERIYSGNLTAESESETSFWTFEIQLTKHFTLENTPGRFLKIG